MGSGLPEEVKLTWADVTAQASLVARQIALVKGPFPVDLYGVPNGGIPAALAVQEVLYRDYRTRVRLVEDILEADAIIDDLIDSGATKAQYESTGLPFYALVNKQGDEWLRGKWVSFPWERMQKADGITDNVRRILQFIGEDPGREGLLKTPERVQRSYTELFAGYKTEVSEVLTTFEDGACDEMVLLKEVPFFSTCEHHLLPFFGKAHIAYVPDGKVIGVSKLSRILEIFSRRLQIQERLTSQITEALMEYLKPKGAACVIEATHLCMVARGVQKPGAVMTTSSLLGVFRDKPEARNEFLQMIRG